MKFTLSTDTKALKSQDCLVLAVFEDYKLPAPTKHFDHLSKGQLRQLLLKSGLEGSIGQTLFLYNVHGIKADRILLVGAGKDKPLTDRDFRRVLAAATKALAS